MLDRLFMGFEERILREEDEGVVIAERRTGRTRGGRRFPVRAFERTVASRNVAPRQRRARSPIGRLTGGLRGA